MRLVIKKVLNNFAHAVCKIKSLTFLDEILENGLIPYRKVGIRRRILFKDVMEYKKRIDAARLETLSKMVEHDQQNGLGY